MAIYHLSVRIIGRSTGRSVVAAAAWQNACRLRDDRLGRVSDFTGKRDVAFSAVLIADGAPADLAQLKTVADLVTMARGWAHDVRRCPTAPPPAERTPSGIQPVATPSGRSASR